MERYNGPLVLLALIYAYDKGSQVTEGLVATKHYNTSLLDKLENDLIIDGNSFMLLLIVGGKKNESKMDIKVKSISPRKKRLRENDSMATRVCPRTKKEKSDDVDAINVSPKPRWEQKVGENLKMTM
ncbi:hypothetical protein HanPSC8_Chr14g0597381 [Helianthus annuus]|nr:hypothetical protein HanPSC8_Chr14g0597381 [Helianthus annuus]